MTSEDRRLRRVRGLIDRVDTALLVLLSVRTRLARSAARHKRQAARPLADGERERAVKRRAEAIGVRVGLPAETAVAFVGVAIAEARRVQGLAPDLGQGRDTTAADIMCSTMDAPTADHVAGATLLRFFPPPARWKALLTAVPAGPQASWLDRAMTHVLAGHCRTGQLAFLQGRRLGIEVSDLGLHWVVTLDRGRLRTVQGDAEAVVRGTATDLLALAGRLEDADRLFFQRRLVLTGDIELGLTARNLLDALPWEEVPLGLRVLLNRGAWFARQARAAFHDGPGRRSAGATDDGLRRGAHE